MECPLLKSDSGQQRHKCEQADGLNAQRGKLACFKPNVSIVGYHSTRKSLRSPHAEALRAALEHSTEIPMYSGCLYLHNFSFWFASPQRQNKKRSFFLMLTSAQSKYFHDLFTDANNSANKKRTRWTYVELLISSSKKVWFYHARVFPF